MQKANCNICYKEIKAIGKSGELLIENGVAHHKAEHPKTPEACYKQFERTWNPIYDRLIREGQTAGDALELAVKKSRDFEKLYKEEAAIRNTLATKLNAIIMVLEHKS